MMINKRLINTVNESKKYIAGNVIFQWISLAANITMMISITALLAQLFAEKSSFGTFFGFIRIYTVVFSEPLKAINKI